MLILIFLLPLIQYIATAFNHGATAPTITPALVNFRGMPSSETNALNTKTNNTCASWAYCTFLPDPSLSGNTLVAFVTYLHSTAAEVPTVSDDKTNTWSHCSSEAHDATNNRFADIFYVVAATTGTRAITVTFPGVTGISQVAVAVAQIYNVNAFDVCAANSATTATTTYQSGSMTTTAANDMIFELACGTSTVTNVGAWTVGSQTGITWKADLADRRDACAIQEGVQTSAGTINPQMTGASNDYVAVGISFKSASTGTAPSGMYIAHIYTSNSAASNTSNLSLQVAQSGNLAVGMMIGSQGTTQVSDTTNSTWKQCNPQNVLFNPGGNNYTNTFYVPNATAGLLATTITVSGTGDVGPSAFYDIAGAATSQVCSVASLANLDNNTGATYTADTAYAPNSSAGISILSLAQGTNTSVGITTPSSAVFDANTVGGESLNGPYYPDQNNALAHYSYSSNASNNWVISQTSSTTTLGAVVTNIASFQAPSATMYPSEVKQAANSATTTATTVAISSYAPYKSGDMLVAIQCSTTSGTQSISDGTNTYTAIDNDQTTSVNGVFCRTWYVASLSSSTVTITATFPSSTFRTLMVEEVANATTLDKHNIAAITSNGTTGILTGTAVTTTSANEALIGFAACDNCNITTTGQQNNASTIPFTQEQNDGQGNVSGYRLVSATGSYSAVFIDTFTGAGDMVAIVTVH